MRPFGSTRFLRVLAVVGLYIGLLAVTGHQSLAQQSEAQQMKAEETAALDRIGPWKLINTGIFAIFLGWFLAKYAPRFFNARSADIQKAIKDATGLKIEADFRYSDIDKRMARLGDEVNRLREQGNREMEREHERVRRQTESELQRIHQNAANEIEALRKEASDRVQVHTAQIALGLAERRLQDRFSHGEPGDLIDDFIRLVDRDNDYRRGKN